MRNSSFRPQLPREGDGVSRLIGTMQAIGYNEGGDIKRAVVTSEYPDFKIRIDGETVETPAEGIICNPDLFQRTETVKINGVEATIEYPNRLVPGARVYVFDPEHNQLVYVLTMAE
ncbi:hypothetical protein DCE79_11045 [Lysinibacillus sp. 2017]|uniref:hypothetical protein n=1 Tax=unclassified Lysinibacillus TaxID=2636778 RepID=UPI000D5280E9|nr:MULTISPECIES: hypothetical protein [unclassified Lysinibacillus]AWE07888.1 hypothetical protein DCE79_11045 [Lysinibacillus sp. 2017]TGN33164.1 hypothetical protein E4L99_15090 [Lysinibacillus sp. S2017]